MNPRKIPTLPAISVLTLIYLVAGDLALQLAFVNASASPVWPPAGIALAALLVLGFRVWPAIFVGAFFVNFLTAGNIFTSLGIASGNTLEALCGAWLGSRFAGGMQVFDRPQNVFKFALAALISTTVAPTFGVNCLAVGGLSPWSTYEAIWLARWGRASSTSTAMAIAAAIAERNRAHAAIEQQKDAVEAANRTKDNFLAMLSHELRTPLTPVMAALDTLDTLDTDGARS